MRMWHGGGAMQWSSGTRSILIVVGKLNTVRIRTRGLGQK
jgi:hypothetical protein